MGYLEGFARNRRSKEKTEVLTARLPKSLYKDFKNHCDELGLSISEAVCLLVDREMTTNDSRNEVAATLEMAEVTTNDVEAKQSVVEANTKKSIAPRKKSSSNTSRFTTNQWKVNDMLPCPICGIWENNKNYSRHLKKKHDENLTTQMVFSEITYSEKIESMVAEKRKEVAKGE